MTAAAPARSIHRHAIAVFALGTAICAMLAAQSAWPIVLERALRDGFLAIGWVAAMAGIGALVLPRRCLSCENLPILRWTTWSAAGIGVVSIVVLGLGLAGWISRTSAWGIIAVGWMSLAIRAWRAVRETPANSLADTRWLWRRIELTRWIWLLLCAAPGLAVLIVAPSVLPGVLWGDEPHGYDVVSYHLQIPREWFEAGRITPLSYNVFSYFPQGMEMHFLLGMHLLGGPWNAMYLAQYQHSAVAVLAACAVSGGMRESGRGAAVVGAVLMLATPWLSMVGSVAYNEALLLLYAALAMIWLQRAMESGNWPMGALAGAMGGLACGAKLTGIAMVVGSLAVAAVAVARPMRRSFSLSMLFVVTAAVCSSPWWARDLAWAGNPVFPEATSVFGDASFSPSQVERWHAAHHLLGESGGAMARLRAAFERVPMDWRYGYALLPAAMIALGINWRDRRAQFLGAVLLLQSLFWVCFTHVQGRFFLTALPAIAMLVAMLVEPGGLRSAIAGATCVVGAACTCLLIGRLATTHPVSYVPQTATDLWNLRPEQQAAEIRDGSTSLALAGDARAFWWPLPMTRLHYRTVFDVNVLPGESLIDAWTRGAPADALVLVDPEELRRFEKTYRGLGSLPKEIEGRSEPFVQPRDSSR